MSKRNHVNNKSVAFFPSVASMARNPYWPLLAAALEKDGIDFTYDTPRAFTRLWLLSNKDKVDILHIHYCQQFYKSCGKANLRKLVIFLFRMMLAQLLGYRVIFTLHDLTPTHPLEPRWVDTMGHFIAIHLSVRVIVHCHEAKRLLAKKYWRFNKVFIVDHPNFSDIYPNDISKADAKNELGFDDNKQFIFTYFGGIRPNKGIETLIDAFKDLTCENYRLVIAGNPQKLEYSEKIKRKTEEDPRISCYFDFISNVDIQFFLNSADIVVLPFERILTSSSTILAMSFGKPVIVPKMGCLPELVEPDAGWLFEPGSVDSLKEKMKLAAASDYKKMGVNAKRSINPLTLERFSKQTLDAYWG